MGEGPGTKQNEGIGINLLNKSIIVEWSLWKIKANVWIYGMKSVVYHDESQKIFFSWIKQMRSIVCSFVVFVTTEN